MVQLILNIFITASTLLILSLSFSLIYSVSKFFHFAHAIEFTFGAYFVYWLEVFLGLPLWLSIPLSIALCGLLGAAMHYAVFDPLRKRYASSIVLLVASLGVYIVLQNVISLAFGDNVRSIHTWSITEGINIAGGSITRIEVINIILSVMIFIILSEALSRLRIGKSLRAVSADPELAEICGIDKDLIVLVSFVAGSALAGVAGMLVALDVDMTPTMGMHALLVAVVAMIIGGTGSNRGILLGVIFLAVAENLAVWFFGSEWEEVVAFGILLVFLLIKPEGFMGKKIRKAEV